jgi:ABC-2 type transport system permease protein
MISGKWIKGLISDIATIWVNEMKMTVKDQGVLIFFILAPLMYPVLYSWIYNNEVVHDVPVAVVDMSRSHLSRQFLRMCDASPDVKIAYHCNNIEEARDLVGRQLVHGILYFPQDFAKQLNRGEQATVGVYCDMSLMLTYKAILQTATNVSLKMNAGISIAQSGGYTNRDDEITAQPLEVEEVPIYNATGGYGNAILPGVLMMVIQQTLLLGIGLAAGTSRERNRNHKLVPVDKHYCGAYRIVLGKALCYFMIYAVMTAYLTLCLMKMFHFTNLATPQTLIGLLTPYVLASIFFGMTISGFIRYRENVILIVVFMSVIFLFMTGISWPQTEIPEFWRTISWLVPSTFGVRGYQKINCMGAEIWEADKEYVALWIQTFIYFVITCLVYRQQINLAQKQYKAEQRMAKAKAEKDKETA